MALLSSKPFLHTHFINQRAFPYTCHLTNTNGKPAQWGSFSVVTALPSCPFSFLSGLGGGGGPGGEGTRQSPGSARSQTRKARR